MNRNILLYLVKYPSPGKVKTRLARTVGEREAARLYRELAEANFRAAATLLYRNICDLVIVFDPPQKRNDFKRWLPAPCEYWPQSAGGLGKRLTHAFRRAFSDSDWKEGGKRVMALGSDTLQLNAEVIQEGFEVLLTKDVVMGPAKDGGYYLIGSRSFQPKLFEDIPWSTDQVLSQTYKRIDALGLSHQSLIQLEDLDEIKEKRHEHVVH